MQLRSLLQRDDIQINSECVITLRLWEWEQYFNDPAALYEYFSDAGRVTKVKVCEEDRWHPWTPLASFTFERMGHQNKRT